MFVCVAETNGENRSSPMRSSERKKMGRREREALRYSLANRRYLECVNRVMLVECSSTVRDMLSERKTA